MVDNPLTQKQKDQLLIGAETIRIYIRDPIDNARVLRSETREQVFDWCFENCEGKFWIGMGFGRFELADDATLFKLRWL